MYAQLGNIVFDRLKGFDAFNSAGDEAIYAEFELINSKPRLQKIGDTLQEINLPIKFHANFCNPDEQVTALKTASNNGEILPLLLGNGKYLGDFVILEYPYTVDEAFSDGTAIQISVNLTIKEFVSYNKIEQKQSEARKRAFAVGDKKAVVLRPPQPPTVETTLSTKVIEATQQANKIDSAASEFENNVSNRVVIAKRIQESCNKANKSLADLTDILDDAQDLQDKFTGLRAIATTVKAAFTGIGDRYPFNDIGDLKTSNTYLQSVIRTFNTASIPLMKEVIIRK